MLEFRQSVVEKTYNGMNGEISCVVNAFSGKRIEDGARVWLEPDKSTVDFSKIISECDEYKISEMAKILNCKYESFRKINADFLYCLLIHKEHIIINNQLEDTRSYAYCRLVLKDNAANAYVEEISLKNDIKNINERINSISRKYFSLSKYKTVRKKQFSECIPVVFSPAATGYFAHEIIGHMLEEDIYFSDICDIGISKFCIDDNLIVIDFVDQSSDLLGLTKYDDAGVEIKPVVLISGGKIRNTIAISIENSLDKKLYGMARRQSYRFPVLPRMRNTFIKPNGNLSENEIIGKYNNAFYIDKIYVGNLLPLTKEYNLYGYGFFIKSGEICYDVCKFTYRSNLQDDLNNIECIGNNFQTVTSGCVKGDQVVRVCMGGPTMSINSGKISGEFI